MRRGRYLAPTSPGYSSTIKSESREAYRFPDGPVWTRLRGGKGSDA
jgi:L-fuconate dehydratase